MGMEMAKEPYYFNDTIPGKIVDHISTILPIEVAKIRLIQVVDGRIFYQQKTPNKISQTALFRERSANKTTRKLTDQEINSINQAHTLRIRRII